MPIASMPIASMLIAAADHFSEAPPNIIIGNFRKLDMKCVFKKTH